MQVGEIYYGHLSSMDPPKDKFFVLAGIALNQDIALLAIIGTEIEMAAVKNRELRQLMVGLDVSDYPFLRYTSKLNCSKVVNKSVSEMHHCIRSGQFALKGVLTKAHKQRMIAHLMSSRRVSRSYEDILRGKVPTLIEFK